MAKGRNGILAVERVNYEMSRTDIPWDPGIGVIDLMIGPADASYVRRGQMGEAANWTKHPAEYMFKNIPTQELDDSNVNPATNLVRAMDQFNIEAGLINFSPDQSWSVEAIQQYPDRLLPALSVDPNRGMDEIRRITAAYDDFGIRAVTSFPAGLFPPVPIDDRRFFPIYAKCIELSLPMFLTVGVPGPTVRFFPQSVERLDEVCWYFPELTIVTRHGGEPWVELLVKLLLKYPNLYYSTSGFAPKYYPAPIVDFLNTRGAEKVAYAGYYPVGLSLTRIFDELRMLPLQQHVWEPFLRDNALRILGL